MSDRLIYCALTLCGMLLWSSDHVGAQDPMDHVDLMSDEMSKPELTRDELIRLLSGLKTGERIDLSSKRLSGLDLRNIDLEGANLRWARLNNTNLAGANLANAILDSAWLIDADLQGANLKGARLASTQLHRANLRKADLSGSRIVANFQRADLTGADLRNADLSPDMKNQSMGLMRTVLRMAKLDGADLRGVNGMRMDAEYASMRGARLDNANFRGAELTGADLTETSVAGLDLSDADVSGASFIRIVGKDELVGLAAAKNLAEANFD